MTRLTLHCIVRINAPTQSELQCWSNEAQCPAYVAQSSYNIGSVKKTCSGPVIAKLLVQQWLPISVIIGQQYGEQDKKARERMLLNVFQRRGKLERYHSLGRNRTID